MSRRRRGLAATRPPQIARVSWPRPFIVGVLLLAFAVVFAALELGSYTRESATFDEPGHVTAGYAALTRGDYRLDIEHPPLLRMWLALPLAVMSGVALDTRTIDAATPATVAFSGPFALGHRFLYLENDADRLLYSARFMTVLLGIALGALIFCWAGQWLGFRAAVIALALYTIEPNLAAHAGLATNDLGVTLFMFGAVYFLWRASTRMSVANIAGLTASVVLAMLSKFSALMLAPVIVVLMVMAAVRRRTFGRAALIGVPLLLSAATWAGAWAAYGFRFAPSATPGWLFALHLSPPVRQVVPTWAALVGWIDTHHLLPNAFSEGFLHGQALVQGRPAFFNGDVSAFGWWSYFPEAFLVKTPLAILALCLGGVLFLVTRRRLLNLDAEAFVVLPIAIYLTIAMTSHLNIGLRHLLPVYPFVILLAARAGHALIAARSRIGPPVLGVLMAVGTLEFATVYPHNLAFFNMAAGGPDNGFRYLADSNVDWGQDLKTLEAWMDRQHVAHINLAYFGTAEPAYYHINRTDIWGTTIPGLTPPMIGAPQLPGYVAVSVTLLDGVPFVEGERQFYYPLRNRAPVADLGGSIRVYWVDQPWW